MRDELFYDLPVGVLDGTDPIDFSVLLFIPDEEVQPVANRYERPGGLQPIGEFIGCGLPCLTLGESGVDELRKVFQIEYVR